MLPSATPMTRSFFLALCAVLLPLSACDSGEAASDLAPNTFTLSVDGGAEATRPGAYHGFQNDADAGRSFAISLGADPAGDGALDGVAVAFVRPGTERLETGTYRLATLFDVSNEPPADAVVGVLVDPSLSGGEDDPFGFAGLFVSSSGTVTVETSTAERVSGRYSASFVSFSGGAAGRVRAQGAFNTVFSDRFDGGGPLARRRPSLLRRAVSLVSTPGR